MLSDYLLEKIFENQKIQEMSNVEQSRYIDIFEEIMTEIRKERFYESESIYGGLSDTGDTAYLSELQLSSAYTD